ncbi:hypothetical protein L2E82_46191 [Cichorium intybus]|uniref:Uncharacterized protein n=1 Tax=Cichorium intybus TaxID=13427 RepID=A0ACB8YSP3_CICIN|nr:hypothetical protein L2E82_46191 [Cichorium intybus]
MNNFQETPLNEADEQEESSWTFYFEEFLWQNDHEIIMSCDETLNSRVPVVASSAINKKDVCIPDGQAKKLRFKKRKTIGVMIDDSLEDTASSPVCSPKVAYFDQVKIKNKHNKVLDIYEEKVGFVEEGNKRKINSNMELKKRGLCLVPLSSLANYYL